MTFIAIEQHGLGTNYMVFTEHIFTRCVLNVISNGCNVTHYLPSFRDDKSKVQSCPNNVSNVK